MTEVGADARESSVEPLTRREREVLALLAERLSDREIAERLTLAITSVKWYTRQIYDKLGVGDRREAVARAAQLGLTSSPVNEAVHASVPPVRRTNLPASLTSFVGRADELAEVTQTVLSHRLVTLTGIGGVGKTRLATEAGIRLVQSSDADSFPDGVWLVELAALSEPTLVGQTIARTLKLPEQSDRTALDQLQEHLAGKRLLLILDNCEHLADACAETVQYLLQYCWQLHILATSREALRLPGEHVYPVQPLAVPDAKERAAERVLASASAQLFMERVNCSGPGSRCSEEDAIAIAHICRQLDGIPLALELAAALTRTMTLAEIADQLHDEMAVLRSSYRATVPRHQTMRSALLWSHGLLSPGGQRLLARVAVFAGGWTLEAAQAVCTSEPVHDIRALLDELVDKSLVLVEDQGGKPRYRLLEPVRQFAREQLAVSGEEAERRRDHANFFLAVAVKAQQVKDTPQEREWLERLEPERDNLRAVNAWAIEGREAEFCLRFNGDLFAFWLYRSSVVEARYWLDEALKLEPVVWTPAALAAEASALEVAAYSIVMQHPEVAQRYFERELALYTEVDNPVGVGAALRGCGYAAMALGDADKAQELTARAFAVSQAAGDQRGVAWSLLDLGYEAYVRGELDRAETLFSDALPALQALGVTLGVCRTLAALAHILRGRGALEQARSLYKEALWIELVMHYLEYLGDGLEGMAGLAVQNGDVVRAARLFGAAQAHREATGWTRYPFDEPAYRRDLGFARVQMDPQAWQAAWEEGCNMSLQQAVNYALAG
jgi:predicted ATPase/DNA-binding CsgD family transcriptional regulator